MAKPILKDVLANIDAQALSALQLKQTVGPLVLDSRKVTSGDTFVAVSGYQFDGRKFIGSALTSGASLVIAEADSEDYQVSEFTQDERVIRVANLPEKLSLLASNYYSNPSQFLKTIAVTGTNGKTSCCYMVAKTLQKMQFECFFMGTLGIGQLSNLQTTDNTTVDAIQIQQVLAQVADSGAQFATMEASSHGIEQGRIGAVEMDTAVFTNLTHDHLDYHGNMQNYAEAKRKLFIGEQLKNAVINFDDRFGRKMADDPEITAKKWLVTTKLPTAGSDLKLWIWAEEVVYSLHGTRAKIHTPWGSGELNSPLIGHFNLTNLLLVIAALGCIFKDPEPILSALKKVHAAPGRMQQIGTPSTPLAIIDYAHTPDALEKTLEAIREHCVGIIWCIFGCGGDRDNAKRPLMARIAEKLSNRVVVTSDNPRTESPEKIREDIFEGFKRPEKVSVINDREEAIKQTIAKASPGDAVLIAGKGHEDYQIIGTEKIHLSDLEIATRAIERMAHD